MAVAVTPSQFAWAIGVIESGSNALRWGDFVGTPSLPQACGRYQIHPAELWTWAMRLRCFPSVGDTWDAWMQRIVEGFYTYHQAQGLTDVEIGVCWHLGHIALPTDPDWNDENYPERFTRAAASVMV